MADSQYPGYKMANQTGRFQIVPYSDFLLFSPERIAPTLRKFQYDNDPERQVIVEAVLDVVQSEEAEKDQWEGHWTTFMETGLHRVVVDILCEDKTYAAGVSEGYPAWTLVLLRRFGVWLSHKMKTDRHNTTTLAQVDEVLGLLPRLWKYTWTKEIIKHKAPFRMWRYKNEDEDLAISFIHTVDVMFNLYVMRQ
ncbi:hypothetical protein BC629DRAFT_1587397 [Irpex lacteus]|nr:hypothetical protein BC629DRAFT_1587397 [Irpex lacteus]